MTFAVAEDQFEPQPGRICLLKRIISNNSYAHDDQGDNPGQENRGLNGVLYKLWPLVSDIAIFVLKRDVKLQLTNFEWNDLLPIYLTRWFTLTLSRSKVNVIGHSLGSQVERCSFLALDAVDWLKSAGEVQKTRQLQCSRLCFVLNWLMLPWVRLSGL